jgi:predicted nucleic-acid-binding Zn-ribbon protein
MTCKNCASTEQQYFPSELSIFPERERLNSSSIYICQDVFICLDCGYAELVVAPTELKKLRVGMDALNSNGTTLN